LAIGSDQSTLIGYKGGLATPKGQNLHNFFFLFWPLGGGLASPGGG